MIIRILGEAQYDVPDDQLDRLNEFDSKLQTAVDSRDESAFAAGLSGLLAAVRAAGSAVPDDVLTPSDLVLPAEDTSLDEVGALLGDEGLIPG